MPRLFGLSNYSNRSREGNETCCQQSPKSGIFGGEKGGGSEKARINMALCTDHNIYFHAEINEICYKCEEKRKKCKHSNKGPDQLFHSRKYLGLAGEWDVCYDCGELIKYE